MNISNNTSKTTSSGLTLSTSRLRDSLTTGLGYNISLSLETDELALIRNAINKNFLKTVQPLTKCASNLTVDKYHTLKMDNHSSLWPKSNRFIEPDVIRQIREFRFWDELEREFGHTEISKRVNQQGEVSDIPEIYWRLVRPNEQSDVGSPHCDIWFADVHNYHETVLNGQDTIKLWIPIYGESGKNGLAVAPNSHKKTWNYEYVRNGNQQEFKIHDAEPPNLELLPTEPGQIVMFGEKLLHSGVLNRGNDCRVSIEITLLLDRRLQ